MTKPHTIRKSWSPTDPFWGHPALQDFLLSTLTSGKMPPACIFSGPRGLGKFEASIWLAQRDRCLAKTKPCLTCPECKHIAAGTHPDVVMLQSEDDEALSIESVRAALATYRHHPNFLDRSRWLLIRNAELLTPSAVTALLKFLEEPPPQTRVIMTTTSVDLLPRTLGSRAAVYRWHFVPTSFWESEKLSGAEYARAAGRPAWIQADETESVLIDEILSVVSGQSIPGTWTKLEPTESQRVLELATLVMRDVLLTQAQATQRLLWPHRQATYRAILDSRPTEYLASLERLANHRTLLRHHVSPRLILQDALAYV